MWRLRGRKAVALTRGDLADGRQGGAAEPVPAQDVPRRAGAAGLSADPRYAVLVQNYSSDLKLMLDQMNRLPPPAASRGTDGTPRMHPGLCAGRSGRCAPRRGWDSDKKNSEKGLQSCANRVSLQVRQCPPEVFQRGITVPSQKTALGPPITTVLETALYLHNSKWGAVLFFHGFCLRNSSIGGG